MAPSTGTSITSNQITNSCSKMDLEEMNERKRKRMQSNRESARRSRMKKQKHLDELMLKLDQIRRENQEISRTINSTFSLYVNVEAENSVLRVQMSELNQRLESLNEIIGYMNTFGGVGNNNGYNSFDEVDHLEFHASGMNMNMMGDFGIVNGYNVDPWTMQCYFNQPSFVGDVLQC